MAGHCEIARMSWKERGAGSDGALIAGLCMPAHHPTPVAQFWTKAVDTFALEPRYDLVSAQRTSVPCKVRPDGCV